MKKSLLITSFNKIIKLRHQQGLKLRNIIKYYKSLSAYIDANGTIDDVKPIINEFTSSAGTAKGDYFHQDLLIASRIFIKQPILHIDIGSRIDGFVSHVASYREIQVYDIRDIPTNPAHTNINFVQKDIFKIERKEICDSLSSLHAIEHFGLGRYGDTIDIVAPQKALDIMVGMLKYNGTLYISLPLSDFDQTIFNAHRIFSPTTILNIDSIKKICA